MEANFQMKLFTETNENKLNVNKLLDCYFKLAVLNIFHVRNDYKLTN